MKKTENKIRREVKYSPDEWNRVSELAKESGMLTDAYVRDRAVNGKIIKIDCLAFNDDFFQKRDVVCFSINKIAKMVNTEKEVFLKDVEEVEKIIDDLGELAENGFKPFSMSEVKI